MDTGCLYLFETTNQALWAEDVAREAGIPVEVVSAPPEARAKCGLAIRAADASCKALASVMEKEGIEFRLHVT